MSSAEDWYKGASGPQPQVSFSPDLRQYLGPGGISVDMPGLIAYLQEQEWSDHDTNNLHIEFMPDLPGGIQGSQTGTHIQIALVSSAYPTSRAMVQTAMHEAYHVQEESAGVPIATPNALYGLRRESRRISWTLMGGGAAIGWLTDTWHRDPAVTVAAVVALVVGASLPIATRLEYWNRPQERRARDAEYNPGHDFISVDPKPYLALHAIHARVVTQQHLLNFWHKTDRIVGLLTRLAPQLPSQE